MTPSTAASAETAEPQPPGRIVFDRFDGALGAEAPYLGTFIVSPDGGNEQQLTVPIETSILEPVWSRRGTRLLLTTWPPPRGPARPAIVSADGSGFVRIDLPTIDADVSCSGWAPDDSLVVCDVTGVATPEPDGIYTLRPDGTDLTRLTTSPFHFTEGSAGQCGGGDSRADFSADGSRVAFIRQRCGSGANPSADESAALMIIGRDGTGLREVVPPGGVKSHPGSRLSWSSGDEWIAFGGQTGELFVVRPDGTGLHQVPLPAELGHHHAYGPDWSPDSSRIVFSLFLDSRGSTDLYSVAPDGSGLHQVTDAPGAETYASWGDQAGR